MRLSLLCTTNSCSPRATYVIANQFIRTVTEVRPEWLLEYAPAYYDPRTLTGELKRVFEGIQRRLQSGDARLPKKARR